jgi:hypothetical protein
LPSIDNRFAFQRSQQLIYEALVSRRNEVAEYYQAAVVVLNDPSLPDRIALAAHALRELMEKLPEEAGAVQMGPDLNTKVNNLRPSWDVAIRQEHERCGELWGNGIGDALRMFLESMADFFQVRENITTGRRDQATQFLNLLDVAPIPLPEDVQRTNAEKWMRLRKYFNEVAHHRFAPAEQQFQEQVLALEVFLAPRLAPRPTDDFAAIDALLAEGPNA